MFFVLLVATVLLHYYLTTVFRVFNNKIRLIVDCGLRVSVKNSVTIVMYVNFRMDFV